MYKNNKLQGLKSYGFSLVELAVVVLIISIIIAGIMAGSNLANTAKTSSLISELSYYTNAKNSFYKIYGYLPGDMAKTLAETTFNGNAADYNSFISATDIDNLGNDTWDSNSEMNLAWLQLSAAGMLKQTYSFSPTSTVAIPNTNRPISDGFGRAGAGFTFLGSAEPDGVGFVNVLRVGASNDTNLELSGVAIPVSNIIEIDKKIDEPNTPLSGKFFATGTGCYNGTDNTATYPAENSRALCTANLAETEFSEM